jgi:hypothetical protein
VAPVDPAERGARFARLGEDHRERRIQGPAQPPERFAREI